MRILNTEELRHVYGGHPGHKHNNGKKKGHVKHACPTTTTRNSSATRNSSRSTRRNKKRHK